MKEGQLYFRIDTDKTVLWVQEKREESFLSSKIEGSYSTTNVIGYIFLKQCDNLENLVLQGQNFSKITSL